MNGRRFALVAACAFFVMFVAGNLIANSWFKSWRLDLTENQLYSLSRGAAETLDGLTEPVELKLYYSRDAATPLPQLQAYAARVRELLQTFQARSHGRVRFIETDVEAFTEGEDAAVQDGIEPVRPFEGADPIYFGLVGSNAIDDRRAIPVLDPEREAFLEYEITRLIYELENPDRVRVALITSLPLDPAAAADPTFPTEQSAFSQELGRLLDVTKLTPDFETIPDVDVLAIIHPGGLSPRQLFEIDQFILRKGRAFIALDPASLTAEQSGGDPFNPMAQAATASDLGPLLERWGVAMSPTVVMDLDGALPVQVQDPASGQAQAAPQPLFFTVPSERLDREDLMTAWLQRGVNFGLAGALSWTEREGVLVKALARTSGNTMRVPAAEAMSRPSPFDIMRMWQPAGRVETIALRLTGALETAFPEGRPADAVSRSDQADATRAADVAPAPLLPRSAVPAELVIVADTDFLADDFYVDPRSRAAAADNAAFALNAIDVLGGSDALVSLRSRAPSTRQMELLDQMEREAQRRIQSRQDELQAELQQTESQLAELQRRGHGSGYFSGNLGAELTAEENAAIERFRARAVQVRSELRSTERDLRSDIDRLQALVMLINMWLGPIIVASAGLFLFWRRQRRVRGGARP